MSEQLKASSFLAEWMHQTIPKLLRHLDPDSLTKTDSKVNIPAGSITTNLECLLTILDGHQAIYYSRPSFLSDDIAQCL